MLPFCTQEKYFFLCQSNVFVCLSIKAIFLSECYIERNVERLPVHEKVAERLPVLDDEKVTDHSLSSVGEEKLQILGQVVSDFSCLFNNNNEDGFPDVHH